MLLIPRKLVFDLYMTENNIISNLRLLVDKSVLENWHIKKLPTDTKTLIGIGKNIVNLKKSFGKTSTEQTAIINSAIIGIHFSFEKNLWSRLKPSFLCKIIQP